MTARTRHLLMFLGAVALGCVLMFAALSYRDVGVRAQRRHDICVRDQRTYDGFFLYTHFLAEQFHASPERTDAGLAALKVKLGPRPSC